MTEENEERFENSGKTGFVIIILLKVVIKEVIIITSLENIVMLHTEVVILTSV